MDTDISANIPYVRHGQGRRTRRLVWGEPMISDAEEGGSLGGRYPDAMRYVIEQSHINAN